MAREAADQEIQGTTLRKRDQAAKKLEKAQKREPEIRKEAGQEIAKRKQANEKNANEDAAGKIRKMATEPDQIEAP